MSGRVLIVFIALVVACRSQQPAGDPLTEIERLEWSFQPADAAQLVVIAASNASREVRCRTMSGLYARLPLAAEPDFAVEHAGILAIERPVVTQALERLLADPEPWCYHPAGTLRLNDDAAYISPRQVAAAVLNNYPSPRFEATLARAREEHFSQGRGWQSEVVARALASIQRARQALPTGREARIDDMVADATPEAFERLVDFVSAGFPWNDGDPPATGEDLAHIAAHVGSCIDWLHRMVSMVSEHPPEKAWGRTAEHDLWDAVATGSLGRKIMDDFDRFEPEDRRTLLALVTLTKPRGYRGWLDEIARRDPDERIRDSAHHALEMAQ